MPRHVRYDQTTGKWEKGPRAGSFTSDTRRDVVDRYNAKTTGKKYAVTVNMSTASLALGHRISYFDIVDRVHRFLVAMQSGAAFKSLGQQPSEVQDLTRFVDLFLCERGAKKAYAHNSQVQKRNEERADRVRTLMSVVVQYAMKIATATQQNQFDRLEFEANRLITVMNTYVPNLDLSDAVLNSSIQNLYDARYDFAGQQYSLTPRSREHLESGDFAIPVTPRGTSHLTSHAADGSATLGQKVPEGSMSPRSQGLFQSARKVPRNQ